jgi:methionine biosynthesis protein MetW
MKQGLTFSPGLRWQDELIAREIPEQASVLDLGCGTGELLAHLIEKKNVRGQGVEIDAESVIQCVGRGVPVLQSNLDEGLQGFPDHSFDYVVLEETLQTLNRPVNVLEEMLRVGRHSIVSFPNFGYWRTRLTLFADGRMPVTRSLPNHWHDTPNIRLFTLNDLLEWTRTNGVRVNRGFSFSGGKCRLMSSFDNLRAEECLLFISRD